jgi:ABC-type sugar transport system substrate-binding protein
MPIGLQAIYDGKMEFTNLKSTAAVTNKALDLMLKILNGEKVQKVNLIDPVIITKDNLLTLKDPGFSGTIDNPGTWKPAKK